MTVISAAPRSEPSRATSLALLLLGIGLAALWVGANLLLPGLAPTGIPSAVTRLAIHAAILIGLWLGLQRTAFSRSKRIGIWLAMAIPFTLWLLAVWSLAVSGAFQPAPGVARLPRLPIAIFAPVLVLLPVLLRSKTVGTLLDATPRAWLIGLQVYRVFGGIFLVNWAHGAAAGVFAWPAGVGDMLTGITALPIALAVSSGAPGGRRAALMWNTFGLIDFGIAVTLGTLSSPGPLQLFGFDVPLSQVGTYPTVLVPAFAVPSSILLHALSIRQLMRIRPGAVDRGALAARRA